MIPADWHEEDEPSMDEIVEICKQARKERVEKRETMNHSVSNNALNNVKDSENHDS